MEHAFKVYDPDKDILIMNERESLLINRLHQSPDIRFRTIIAEFVNKEEDQKDSIERLIEITDFYFNKIQTYSASRTPVPFLTRPKSLVYFIEIIEAIRKMIEENEHQLTQRLSDIFLQKSDYEPCLKALREVDPPVVNENNKYILGKYSKQAMVAFLDVLKLRNKIDNRSDEEYANILSNTFGMSIVSRTIRGQRTKVYEKYHPQFKALIK